jgi:hypothetical protein
MSALEAVLTHDGRVWRARVAGLELAEAELAELDRSIAGALAATHGGALVAVRFDAASLPVWLRQYHAHYCNYALRVPAAP